MQYVLVNYLTLKWSAFATTGLKESIARLTPTIVPMNPVKILAFVSTKSTPMNATATKIIQEQFKSN